MLSCMLLLRLITIVHNLQPTMRGVQSNRGAPHSDRGLARIDDAIEV